ncbi:hypothetical protein [Aeromicrobium yanjiei]|uniref:hypothetical protein n=1 Tax=Aeromicrobium yanjiei TaxID=2662028 RepID=UPI001299BC34|nr:hypothetical protein [Aeromicrobium yanjiei]
MTRKRTWWQRWVYDAEEARERREERVFTNSAWFGLGFVVLGALNAFGSLSVGANLFSYVLPTWLMIFGGLRVGRGIRRWRAGGEFNLPGSPGPVLRSPPPHQRGE